MKAFDFIKDNCNCPVCDKPLTLFLQIIDETLFKVDLNKKDDKITFVPFRNVKDKRPDDVIDIALTEDNGIDLSTSSRHLQEILDKSQFFFYYLCEVDAFSPKDNTDCSISMYHSCYYKSSTYMSINKKVIDDEVVRIIDVVDQDHKDIVNATEQFSFKNTTNPELEKVYLVSLDFEDKKTSFWHYAFTKEQEADENFEPKLLEKVLPTMPSKLKLDFDNRENLYSKFESWILMS